MEVAFRQANQTDYQWLYDLKVTSMRQYVEEVYGWDDIIQKKYFDEDFRPDDITIVVVEGSDAGMFELSRDSEGYFMKRIEVHPRYQGRGVGTKIIQEIIRQASSVEEDVRLMVFKVNPARNPYERLGFKVVEETKTHYKMSVAVAKKPKAEQGSAHQSTTAP